MQRPRIILNFAMTVDGKVSTAKQTPSGFTSAFDKHRLLEIR
jgi:riboflavin biosynthesis pyrimidine reductase